MLRHRRIELVLVMTPVDPFQPGHTLLVLGYAGEGRYRVWHQGRIIEDVPQFWPARNDSPLNGHHQGRVVREGRVEWWVHVEAMAGVQGWIRMPYLNDLPLPVDGADACG